MANDRIYLRCNFCQETQLLHKYYPTLGGYTWYHEKIESFLSEHLTAHRGGDMNLAGDPGFTLITESDPIFSPVSVEENK